MLSYRKGITATAVAITVTYTALSAGVVAAPLKRLRSSALPPQFGVDQQLWQTATNKSDKFNLLRAIDQSLRYLDTPASQVAYRKYPVSGITHERVRQSLRRFRTLLTSTGSPEALGAAVRREFEVYQSVGKDGKGTVDFTGYYEATYTASLKPTAEYRYPLYRVPSGFANWPNPHPTRLQLEGADALQSRRGKLRGSELVWLRDRLEAYLIQVQGSARLSLTNGKIMTVGVAGKTNYPYVSLGKELIKDGKIKESELTLPVLNQYFQSNPEALNDYIPRNNRFVFFRPTNGAPATGSLGVPVTTERSIATDKSLMPPGALALIQTKLPYLDRQQQLQTQKASRFVLDQDTGGAIKGPGRVDIFMGTGSQAKAKAGIVNTPGQLYYLLLKP